MKVAIAGFAGAGKTTVFNALTGLAAAVGGYGERPNLGVIKVPDPRLDHLASVFKPRKVASAEVAFVDLPPPRSPAGGQRSVLDAGAVAQLREREALVEVVRGFSGPGGEAPDPVADACAFTAELVLADLAVVERRLERLRKERGQEREKEVLERCRAHLEKGEALRTLHLEPGAAGLLAGFALVSLRPLLVVLNVGEAQIGSPMPPGLVEHAAAEGAEVMSMCGKVEMELAALDPEDRAAFASELGLAEPARDRFIRACYHLLDLVSFFTHNAGEVRAWPVRRGTTAVRAAGKVHSDMQRGFIRAEVIAFEDFVRYGSEARCREAGRLRLEGRDYVVQDGDIIHFLFKV